MRVTVNIYEPGNPSRQVKLEGEREDIARIMREGAGGNWATGVCESTESPLRCLFERGKESD